MKVYAWLVKGFAGLVKLLEEMTCSGERMEDGWLGQLESHVTRLKEVCKRQKEMR